MALNPDELRKHVRQLWDEAWKLDPYRCEEIAAAVLAPVGRIDVPSGVFCWSNLRCADLRRMGPLLFTACLEGRG